jgi:shikimate kinase
MAKQKPAVVSSGAGAILEADNRDWMQKTGTRIYLRTPLELLERRLRDKQDRPLLTEGSLLSALTNQLAKREPWYQESEIQIDAGNSSPAQLAQQICHILRAQT